MPWKNSPDLLSFIGAILISIISGFISLANRILKGHPVSLLWIISELATSVLCGYLMYYTYPHIEHRLPAWATLPVAISFGAYAGMRIIREFEDWVIKRYKFLMLIMSANEKPNK